MKQHIVVIGGGYVGQLVQLAEPSVRILDWRKAPPVHHLDSRWGPQYLWEPIPGVESFSFQVTTLVDDRPPTPDSILAYKKKIGKQDDGGDWEKQFQHKMTGWFSALPQPRVEYGRHVSSIAMDKHLLIMADGAIIEYDILINTIPMDFFLTLCVVKPQLYYGFKKDPIYMISEKQSETVEGMILNYLSSPDQPYYRETKIGDRLFYETIQPGYGGLCVKPGKIHPHPENEQVINAFKLFDVQSFGRYATWRPDELAHETWRHIAAWKELL